MRGGCGGLAKEVDLELGGRYPILGKWPGGGGELAGWSAAVVL